MRVRTIVIGMLVVTLAATVVVAMVRARRAADTYAYLSSAALDELEINLSRPSRITPTGVTRAFALEAKPAKWELVQGVQVDALTYNGTVPGPTIRVTEGDTVKVTIRNSLPQSTSIHWHGLHIANDMDGVPDVTQRAIGSGETFVYEFVASHAGTFMYHPHNNSIAQIDRGLYGLLIVDPQKPDRPRFDKEFTMMLGAWTVGASSEVPMAGMAMGYNYFTINGKAFPATTPWTVRKGDLVRVRIVNISNLTHPMHLHGQDFKVVAKDGEPLPPTLQQTMNTLTVNAGETYDIVFLANNPGTWVFHCHELHHVENAGVEPGGLIQVIQYEGVGSALPPGRAASPGPTGAAPRPASASSEAALRIALETRPAPPAAGPVDLDVKVTDRQGRPVRGATVRIEYGMAGMDSAPAVAAETATPGIYRARVALSMTGAWSIRVKAEVRGAAAEATINVRVK